MSTPLDSTTGTATAPIPEGGWANPRGGYLFFAGFAAIGGGMGSLTPAVLTITLKASLIDPAHATTILSAVVGIAGLAGIVTFPLIGRLSDRTTSRFGRRRPFLALGALLFAIGAVLLVAANSVPLLILGDLITAIGYSSTLVAVTATIADQVEPSRRGPVSSLVGLSLPLGALLGLFVAQTVSQSLTLQILLPAAFAVVAPALLAVRLKERPLRAEERSSFSFGQFISTFWTNPRKNPNFAWTWFSRFLIYFGVTALQSYQVFYLLDRMGFNKVTVAGAVFLTTLVLTGIALVFAPIAGKISDVVQRRKPFVAVSAVVFGIGLVVAAVSHDFVTFIIATAIVGLGQGVYFAVDLALVTQVLPSAATTGKDLGVMNLASTLPFAFVPLAAPAILAIGATAGNAASQNYSLLFLLGAAAGLVGAILIIPIRGIK